MNLHFVEGRAERMQAHGGAKECLSPAVDRVKVAVGIGVAGYHHLAGFSWIDALLNACMILAVDAEGHAITTVEGLATKGGRALLDAFVREDAMQCGFCTPGMFMSCASVVAAKGAKLTEADARAACAGNLCRCGTYPHVLKAALAAAKAV